MTGAGRAREPRAERGAAGKRTRPAGGSRAECGGHAGACGSAEPDSPTAAAPTTAPLTGPRTPAPSPPLTRRTRQGGGQSGPPTAATSGARHCGKWLWPGVRRRWRRVRLRAARAGRPNAAARRSLVESEFPRCGVTVGCLPAREGGCGGRPRRAAPDGTSAGLGASGGLLRGTRSSSCAQFCAEPAACGSCPRAPRPRRAPGEGSAGLRAPVRSYTNTPRRGGLPGQGGSPAPLPSPVLRGRPLARARRAGNRRALPRLAAFYFSQRFPRLGLPLPACVPDPPRTPPQRSGRRAARGELGPPRPGRCCVSSTWSRVCRNEVLVNECSWRPDIPAPN